MTFDTTVDGLKVRPFLIRRAKRFSDYETVGELFRENSDDTRQLSVAQQIWRIVQTVVNAIMDLFGLTEETTYDTIINRSEEIKNI